MQILNISEIPSEPFLKPKRISVLITAKRSFIAQNILEQLDYDLTAIGKEDVDLTDSKAVNVFLKDLYFDFVIHTACVGGRHNDADDIKIFDDNYNMFENLLNNQDHFGYLINFGSGADQFNSWYGKAKRVIRGIIKEKPDMINLRCFGVWGKYEKPDRFPTTCIRSDEITIEEDKLMRYIHVDDLVKIVDGIIKKWPNKRDITISEPILLSEFAKQLNPNIKVIVKGLGKDYI